MRERVTSLVAVVAPHTGKTVKNGLHVFERGENLLQNGTACEIIIRRPSSIRRIR